MLINILGDYTLSYDLLYPNLGSSYNQGTPGVIIRTEKFVFQGYNWVYVDTLTEFEKELYNIDKRSE